VQIIRAKGLCKPETVDTEREEQEGSELKKKKKRREKEIN